jgi:hypothetical protein
MNIAEQNIKAFNAIYDFGLTDEIIKKLPAIKERVTKVEDILSASVFTYLYRSPKLLIVVNPRLSKGYYRNSSYFGIALTDINERNKTLLDKILPVNTGSYFYTSNIGASGSNPEINEFMQLFTTYRRIEEGETTKVEVAPTSASVLIKISFEKFTEKFLKSLDTLGQGFITGSNYHGVIYSKSVPRLVGSAESADELLEKLRTYLKTNEEHFFKNKTFKIYPSAYNTKENVLDGYETFLEMLYPGCQITRVEQKPTTQLKNNNLTKIIEREEAYSIVGLIAEINNTRLAVIGTFFQGAYHRRADNAVDAHGMSWNLYSFEHEKFEELYDYLDVGRIFFNLRTNANGALIQKAGVLHDLEDPKTISSELLTPYLRDQPGQVTLIDNDTVDRIMKREIRKAAIQDKEAKSEVKLKEKAQKLFKDLSKQKGDIKVNDMVIKDNVVKYETETLSFRSGHSKTWLSDLLVRASNRIDIKYVNYDYILTGFIAEIMRIQNGTIKGTLGTVKFEVTHTEKTNTRGHYLTQYKINGNRINKGEVQECLERAVCYQNQTDYDYFLQEVKKCSLRIHAYLQIGVDTTVYDELKSKHLKIKFLLDRKDGKNRLIINKKKYPIKNINRFLSIENKGNLMEMVELLLNEDIVEGIKLNDMKGIIDKATETFKNAIAKSEELLNKTVKMFKLELETKNLEGRDRTGYRINGKRRTYFLEIANANAHTNKCGVYDYDTGRYICIVDKSTAQVGKDKIVNRIFALHNDEKVATQVNTI